MTVYFLKSLIYNRKTEKRATGNACTDLKDFKRLTVTIDLIIVENSSRDSTGEFLFYDP